MAPILFFLFKFALAIQGLLWFHTDFNSGLFLFLWEMSLVFCHGLHLGSVSHFGEQGHLTILILSGLYTGRLHVFVSSLFSFISAVLTVGSFCLFG